MYGHHRSHRGPRIDKKAAQKLFLGPFVLASLTSVALFGLSIALLWPMTQTSTTAAKLPIPAAVLGPLVLAVLHLLAGFCTAFVKYLRLCNVYTCVGLCSYVLFHCYTYVAIGTWAGVMGNGLGPCGRLAAMRAGGGLVAELEGVPESAREDFGVVDLMGLDAQTCSIVRWTWGLMIAAAVAHLFTALAAYLISLRSRK